MLIAEIGIISKEASSLIRPELSISLAVIPIISLLAFKTAPPLSPNIIDGGTIIRLTIWI